MKKLFTIFCTAALICACTNENEPTLNENYGYIDLGLTADNTVTSRATQTVDNLTGWTIKVGETTYTGASQAFAAGTYTITAHNYADDAAACAANSNWGAARYEGSVENVTVTAGTTATPTIACGTAKNARLKVVFADSFKAIVKTGYSLTTTGDRALAFTASNTDALAYYAASANVGYDLVFTLNSSETPKTISGTVTLGAAATEKTITVSANTNGTINISISIDNEFTNGGNEDITIDASTGDKVTA